MTTKSRGDEHPAGRAAIAGFLLVSVPKAREAGVIAIAWGVSPRTASPIPTSPGFSRPAAATPGSARGCGGAYKLKRNHIYHSHNLGLTPQAMAMTPPPGAQRASGTDSESSCLSSGDLSEKTPSPPRAPTCPRNPERERPVVADGNRTTATIPFRVGRHPRGNERMISCAAVCRRRSPFYIFYRIVLPFAETRHSLTVDRVVASEFDKCGGMRSFRWTAAFRWAAALWVRNERRRIMRRSLSRGAT